MKRKVTRRHAGRNDGGLPLFDWAHAHCGRRPGYAVRYIQQRGGYSTSTAELYARLAGLCVEKGDA
jgi:hypothetical protein